jgi:TonB family protein
MKTFTLFIATALLSLLLAGCGKNSKGPDQQVSPSSASGVTDQETPPPDQLAVDKEPTLLKKVEPVYPELAKKAGLEGKVWVKIWVDTEGKPKQVVVLKSDSDVFNQVTIDAAKQFLFTPAYIKDKPVAVWVSVPFRYALAEKQAQKSGASTGSGSPEEAGFLKGYIAAKEEALSSMQNDADNARKTGAPNATLEKKIQAAKGELLTLKDALKAMQAAK